MTGDCRFRKTALAAGNTNDKGDLDPDKKEDASTTSAPKTDSRRRRTTATTKKLGGDYEPRYPPLQLSSVYDSQIPAGLCGEAIRAALRSDRGVCFECSQGELPRSVVEISGGGTLSFVNGKLSHAVSSPATPTWKDRHVSYGSLGEGGLLTARGHVVDRLLTATFSPQQSFLLGSPGNGDLAARLAPTVFPLDDIQLHDATPQARVFMIAATKLSVAQQVLKQFVFPHVMGPPTWHERVQKEDNLDSLLLPAVPQVAVRYTDGEDHAVAFWMQHLPLPPCAAQGYTVVVLDEAVGRRLAEALAEESNWQAPVLWGPREYNDIRLEAGWAAYGREFRPPDVKLSPYNAGWNLPLVNLEKGCFVGQEAVAAANPLKKTPPSKSTNHKKEEDSKCHLYTLVVDDFCNAFPQEGWISSPDNATRRPKVGDVLYLLGSNQQVQVGRITSLGPVGTTAHGRQWGLVLLTTTPRRIRFEMQQLDLTPTKPWQDDPRWQKNYDSEEEPVPPLPFPRRATRTQLDPLEGVEVIIKDTYTIGTLYTIAGRRYSGTATTIPNMYELDEDIWNEDNDLKAAAPAPAVDMAQNEAVVDVAAAVTLDEEEEDEEEKEKAAAAAAAAAQAEAQRKEEKMKLLQERAAKAMAARKRRKEEEEEENKS